MQCSSRVTMDLVSLILLGVISRWGFVYCKSECSTFKTCGDCIGHALERCVWCAQDTMSSTLPEKHLARCQPRNEVYKENKYNTEWCPQLHINDPDSEKPKIITDKKFSIVPGKEIQFRPQEIELTLRPGVPTTFDMYYQPAQDYPLDMYFVMDDSYTMQTIAEELAKNTLKIYRELKLMTNNVRLGFGTFVEKPAMPYCDSSFQICHAFEHRLSLTDDMALFEKTINTRFGSGSNYDSPEAGFDALMQIMICGDKIGWRTPSETGDLQSRRIIIFATDATYHSAGDGKMVGAYTPNDMKCHLDRNNRFYDETSSKTLDYPSVSQISYVAKENNFRIVFAVDKTIKKVYDALANQISDIANTVELESDKIIAIIRDAYVSASRNVKLQHNTNKVESIKIETDCDIDADRCTITQENSNLTIKATIKVMSCDTTVPEFEIKPLGLSEKLTVKLKINCQCQCETRAADPSSECNLAGIKQCGVCKCNTDRSGDKCEIGCNDSDALKEQCKEPLKDVNAYCNDHGKCICGKCDCENSVNKSFSGEFCQYNDGVCRKICPADKGDCKLGQCHCFDKDSWTGPTCSCPVSNKKCIGPFSKEVCSGRGNCNCGKCKCKSIDGTNYFGNYCESCKDCTKELCEQLKEYAHCNIEQNTKETCDGRFNQTTVQEVIFMNKTAIDAKTTATGCRKTLSNGKIIVYKYQITTDSTDTARLVLMIQDELESPPEANIWITVGSVVGGVLLIGLLTLIIWKVSTDIYDKREYEKFCKEATYAGFDVTNPVYEDPNVNFVNPAYCSADQ